MDLHVTPLWVTTSLLAWFNSSKNSTGPHSILTPDMSLERK